MPGSEPAIRVDRLSKRYGLPLYHNLQRIFSAKRQEDSWALKDISVEVQPGDTLGIIGPNGSGKSTLLKALANIVPITEGSVRIRGRVHAMIELNAGLRPQLTGRENVMLLSAIKGLSARDIAKKMKAIEEFCALGSAFDKPVYQYSSGMAARIGVSVATFVEAEILLFDEALTVGDLEFAQKCLNRLNHLQQSGDVTMVIVSHNLSEVRRLCPRTLLLEKGRMSYIGETSDTIEQYYQRYGATATKESASRHVPAVWEFTDPSLVAVTDVSVSMLDSQKQEVDKVQTGDQFTVEIEYVPAKVVGKHAVELSFSTVDGLFLAAIRGHFDLVDSNQKHVVVCRISECPLIEGSYQLHMRVLGQWGQLYYAKRNVRSFTVETSPSQQRLAPYGYFKFQAEWTPAN